MDGLREAVDMIQQLPVKTGCTFYQVRNSDVNKATHDKAKAMGRNSKSKILNLRINGSNGMSVYRAVWPQFANATNILS